MTHTVPKWADSDLVLQSLIIAPNTSPFTWMIFVDSFPTGVEGQIAQMAVRLPL